MLSCPPAPQTVRALECWAPSLTVSVPYAWVSASAQWFCLVGFKQMSNDNEIIGDLFSVVLAASEVISLD